MSEKYNPRVIENKWQDFWKNNKTFKSAVNKNKEKYYILEMFPTHLEKYIWVMSEIIPWVMS